MNIRVEPCVSGAKRHPRTISNSRRANFKRLALWTGTFGNFRCKSAFRQATSCERLVLGTPHGPKLSFTAISISCSEPRTSAPGSSGRGRQKFFGLLAGQPIPQPGTLLAHVGDVGPTSNHIVIVSRPELRRSAASSMTARSFEVAPGDGDLFLKVGSPSK
jgi:hypothetical protein